MDLSRLNPAELRASMRLALDVVMAHRIAKGLSLDRARVTAMRELLEERVRLSLEEVDVSGMPPDWSWQKAAETISLQVALAIVDEQKNEPPASHF